MIYGRVEPGSKGTLLRSLLIFRRKQNALQLRRILSHSMNSHESAREERTGGFEGRVVGTELEDNQQVGVNVLWGRWGSRRILSRWESRGRGLIILLGEREMGNI